MPPSPALLWASLKKESLMTSFVHVSYSTEHPGVERAQRVAALLQFAWRRARHGSLLLTAVVSALLVVVDQVIDTWSDGHLLAGWVLLWAVAFGGLALLAAPVRALGQRWSASFSRWNTARVCAAADRRLWDLAQTDVRVMADIQCAFTRAG
jgi:hypothetical protein